MAFSVSTNVSESEQSSSFQNANLHSVNDEITCSLAITPKYPEHIKTEKEAATFLAEHLSALSLMGWVIEAQIGKSEE